MGADCAANRHLTEWNICAAGPLILKPFARLSQQTCELFGKIFLYVVANGELTGGTTARSVLTRFSSANVFPD